MNPDMQPTSDPVGDLDIGPGGGGTGKPFGGFKFKGPPSLVPQNGGRVTLVRTKTGIWNGNSYSPPPQGPNSDRASYFRLELTSDGGNFAEFQYPAQSGSNEVNATRIFLDSVDGITGLVVYPGAIPVNPDNSPNYGGMSPIPTAIAAFNSDAWPTPGANGRMTGECTWNGTMYELTEIPGF